MKIYLAGPMRGYPQFNFPAFMEAAKSLRARGHEVFNPAEADLNKGFDPTNMTGEEDLSATGFSLRDALGTDLAWICANAEAVAFLPGSGDSKGARAEMATAEALGLAILPVDAVKAAEVEDGRLSGVADAIKATLMGGGPDPDWIAVAKAALDVADTVPATPVEVPVPPVVSAPGSVPGGLA